MPRTHKSLKRLYVDHDLSKDAEIVLDRDQSNYLVNVLRKRAGDELVMFNGRDGAWLCEIVQSDRKATGVVATIQITAQTSPADLWYGFAPLKSGRLDYMVQKATEMGVGIMQPVITQYTQVSRLKHAKMQANIIEAAEQCEVLTIPELAPQVGLLELLKSWNAHHGDRQLLFADEVETPGSQIDTLNGLKGQKIGLLIGPEGGFSDQERTLLREQSFVLPISLGRRILRADTAAVAGLALIQSIIGDWR